jgi:indolepyruvate ferredoxin oxidoreductase beta subunit
MAMETNIILAGVGGQGIVSISYVIDMAAIGQGLNFKQAEVHGMSQRGGAVQSHLRVSDSPIHSDLVPKGRGTLILSVEPLESLRYVDYLMPKGTVVSSTDPFINIPDYGDVERVLDAIGALENHTLVPADRLARQAGSGRAQNMVLLGAASPYLGLREELLEKGIIEAFSKKGEKIQKVNVDAFRLGKAAGQTYRDLLNRGFKSRHARLLIGRLQGARLDNDAIAPWKEVFERPIAAAILEVFASNTAGRIPTGAAIPASILAESGDLHARLPSLLFPAN